MCSTDEAESASKPSMNATCQVEIPSRSVDVGGSRQTTGVIGDRVDPAVVAEPSTRTLNQRKRA